MIGDREVTEVQQQVSLFLPLLGYDPHPESSACFFFPDCFPNLDQITVHPSHLSLSVHLAAYYTYYLWNICTSLIINLSARQSISATQEQTTVFVYRHIFVVAVAHGTVCATAPGAGLMIRPRWCQLTSSVKVKAFHLELHIGSFVQDRKTHRPCIWFTAKQQKKTSIALCKTVNNAAHQIFMLSHPYFNKKKSYEPKYSIYCYMVSCLHDMQQKH